MSVRVSARRNLYFVAWDPRPLRSVPRDVLSVGIHLSATSRALGGPQAQIWRALLFGGFSGLRACNP
jgi:hypothetical protein